MPAVTFVSPTGHATTIDAEIGQSLLHAALANDVEGIVGECGGSLACGTCHVYVEARFLHLLSPPSANELAVLDFASEPKISSRLCCQLLPTTQLEGLVMRVAPQQP